MKKSKLIIFGIGILVVFLIVVFVIYYVHALKSVEVKEVKITAIKSVSLTGFTAEGIVELYNPSLVGLSIYDSEIYFIHKKTNQTLGIGKIKGGRLKAKSISGLEFSQDVELSSIINTITDSLETGEAVITIKGDIYISRTLKITAPFEADYDLSKDIKKYVDGKLSWLGFLKGI